MQIRTGLHSQLSEVHGKKHHDFKTRTIRARDTPRPVLCQLGLMAGEKWLRTVQLAVKQPHRSLDSQCLWNFPSATQVHKQGGLRVVPPGLHITRGKLQILYMAQGGAPQQVPGTPDMVLRVVWKKPLPGYFNCVHVQQQNTTAEWPLAGFVRRYWGFPDLLFSMTFFFKILLYHFTFFHLTLQKNSVIFVETNSFL